MKEIQEWYSACSLPLFESISHPLYPLTQPSQSQQVIANWTERLCRRCKCSPEDCWVLDTKTARLTVILLFFHTWAKFKVWMEVSTHFTAYHSHLGWHYNTFYINCTHVKHHQRAPAFLLVTFFFNLKASNKQMLFSNCFSYLPTIEEHNAGISQDTLDFYWACYDSDELFWK